MIRFYGLLDFYPDRKEIKEEFDELTIEEKRLYKKEVYSLCFEREYIKDLIWEYLNDWEESLPNLIKEYKLKKNKVELRKKMEMENDSIENNDDNINNFLIYCKQLQERGK